MQMILCIHKQRNMYVQRTNMNMYKKELHKLSVWDDKKKEK